MKRRIWATCRIPLHKNKRLPASILVSTLGLLFLFSLLLLLALESYGRHQRIIRDLQQHYLAETLQEWSYQKLIAGSTSERFSFHEGEVHVTANDEKWTLLVTVAPNTYKFIRPRPQVTAPSEPTDETTNETETTNSETDGLEAMK